ncbi:TPA: IS3 family transposase [Klebsiella pneumoniae]|nr:IS3 family transposase [Klebsiella pneumoniae]
MDNSPMERVFKSLKSEWIPVGGYSDIRQMMQDITVWIHYYNQHRPHTFNGGLSPYEYENQCKEGKMATIINPLLDGTGITNLKRKKKRNRRQIRNRHRLPHRILT